MKYSAQVIVLVLMTFILLEHIYPLRVRRESLIKRSLTNLGLALLALPFTRLLTYPFVYSVASFAERSHWGILNLFKLQGPFHLILGFLLLDYFIYWWHLANHRVRFLWRFHQVHHADKDMDASTALRFHFGELLLSALVRIGLILIFGFKIETLMIFDLTVTTVAIFHHSNLKLPLWLEGPISKIIVTPLFHQNHHSFYKRETDSNYSAVFSIWDRLHGSHTSEMSPEKIVIGLPTFLEKLSLLDLLAMPFAKLKQWPMDLLKRK
ncbi:MAG: sterol desaturase family protein [Bacteriovorax sp.]